MFRVSIKAGEAHNSSRRLLLLGFKRKAGLSDTQPTPVRHRQELDALSDTNSRSVAERMVACLVSRPSPNLFFNTLRPILQHSNRTATCVWKLFPRRSCLFRAP